MRGLIIGLVLGAVLTVFAYENRVLSVGSPGKIDSAALQDALPKITVTR